MTLPLVSVIVPMYNHERYIVAALKSVIKQSYRPMEIIAIDDGSSDDTERLAKEYLKSEYSNCVIVARGNRGAAETINQAISLCSGKYVNILNSDDEFVPERIMECVSVAERSGREMIYGGVEFIDDEGEIVEPDEYIRSLQQAQDERGEYPTLGFALMRNQLAISSGNLFFTRSIANRLGGFRSYKYVHDWDFILRSVFYTEPLFIPKTLYRYRFHGTNSFKELAAIASYETSELMRNFLWSVCARVPINHRAPSPHCWPGVFHNVLSKWGYQAYMPPALRNADGLEF